MRWVHTYSDGSTKEFEGVPGSMTERHRAVCIIKIEGDGSVEIVKDKFREAGA